ncbi:putative sporulation protein YtxC [Cohnella silvisoli]|uniref:Sporulation protein YtxC n=1 Tax=Cohnella silvisoli TaxID=2873699 RepID=A0ABV1L457_9BACL|nr:putative sporulation protein YtxC [Cohnella silvisoli]MCD9026489.1 putative sporulation protein YtxC [Cohnella silvisoli]
MKKVQFVVEYLQDHPSLERLAGMLNRTLVGTENPVDSVQWELSREDGFIRCQFPLGPGPQDKKIYCDRVGRVLAEYTLSDQEPSLLRNLFQIRFGLKDAVETDALIAEAVSLLDGEPEMGESWMGRGRERRLQKLASRFSLYLEDHEHLHLDGFLRFRLSDYRAEVQEAAETAIEERLMERQYQEFMTLLKSMVEWQETRTSAVHVLHSGGHAFRLLDEEMRPLEQDFMDTDDTDDKEVFKAEEEQEEESRVVSRLLAASPRQLYIHTPEPESQVIRTIIGIFGDRAELYPDLPAH